MSARREHLRGWLAAVTLVAILVPSVASARVLEPIGDDPLAQEGGGGGGGGGYPPPPPPPPPRYGTFCQESYVDMADLEWQDAECNGFDGEVSAIFSHPFDVRMEGWWTRDGWLPAGDANPALNGPDTVDLVYFGGHGYPGQIVIANVFGMDLRFNLSQVRWGDSAQQLKVAVANACNTLTGDVGTIWATTWWGTFSAAGLKMFLGATDLMYNTWDGNRDRRFGRDVVDGRSFDASWRDAHTNLWRNEHPATAVTGTSCTDCWYRMDNMNRYNFVSVFPRLTGAQTNCFCRRSE